MFGRIVPFFVGERICFKGVINLIFEQGNSNADFTSAVKP